MINRGRFLKSWIESINMNPNKSSIVEKEIYALYLVEYLARTKVDFVFKGGTSLMLMFEKIKRFSTDIDILVEEDNLDNLVEKFKDITEDGVFIDYQEDKRNNRGIKKRHFKFYYNSSIITKMNYILLDIVYGKIPYTSLEDRIIAAPVIKVDEPYIIVKTPNITNILIDKLTAFAPNTIGVLYSSGKYTEIIKQLYDVSLLYEECSNFCGIDELYNNFARIELGYRDNLKHIKPIDCLQDSIDTCKNILSKGSIDKEEYIFICNGIKGFSNFLNGIFYFQNVYEYAVNVYILCLIIKCGCIEKYKERASEVRQYKITKSFISKTYKELKYILSDKYLELEEAIKIEQNYFVPINV